MLTTTTAAALSASAVAAGAPSARAAGQTEAAATGPDRAGALRVGAPTVEYVRDPLGLDTPEPRLSWPLLSDAPGQTQSAYQIRVASSARGLAEPDVWDSGKVVSDRSVLVAYAGPALRPLTRYHWSVRVWNAAGEVSGWSENAWWETVRGRLGVAPGVITELRRDLVAKEAAGH
ncbi:glycoside hydrolase family 78 protein, partial [Streptomyces niveus]